ncbi:MAG: type I phosphomannose isomerase catalytic subunit [Planctomycetota bacterium]
MYPLRFRPIFRRYLWGGRRLATTLQKPIGEHPAAESWEIVDHRDGQSVVAFGELDGRSLHDLVVEFDIDLVGRQTWQRINDESLPPNLRFRFPLLLKFLDASKNLSVQVHPDDELAATIDPPDLGKTEAWLVLAAEPDAKIFAGLKEGVTKEAFANAIQTGDVEPLLHSFHAERGDCVFIPAGTMHAIGAGLLIAEIQQASNTTYRVFDWNRVDADGNARALHIEQALSATHFDQGPVQPIKSDSTRDSQMLVQCNHFNMKRQRLTNGDSLEIETLGEFVIVANISGSVMISNDPSGLPLELGQTALIPACLERVTLTPDDDEVELLLITP